MEPLTLRTERLILRPFEERDVEAVATACDDPDIQRFVPVPEPYTLKDAVEFVRGASPAGWREDTMYNFGVFTHSGELVGSMGLVRLAHLRTADRQAELGFWTARGHRRRGYTAEAGRAVVDWAFDSLGVERLEWVAQAENEGSRAVALRIGFVEEGIQRARIVHRGTRRDARIAALLPSDWGRAQETPYLPSERS
ncbi:MULTISPECIES: GNAT family N-acetyltransferase [unclassified Streptomyces]|uniref:GNAT family N-acetyltransferase n=1 Tax=unclassified Streptomyces TaxID=2593676 RepID=UPI002DDBA858|nr:GNAT family N-acetyltransferase [Streptomyces sp. NBC_01795]WSA94387.1 GNAT family N-acetyltransferase [Streptomyces sp. NBC_01795]WSS41775.1 GNAT family N-acetyltransferase [Streptomyces sp. NBC_01187]